MPDTNLGQSALPTDDESHDLRVILRVVRIGFVLLMVLLTMLYIIRVGSKPTGDFDVGLAITWWIPVLVALLLAMVFLAVDIFTPKKKIQVVSGVAFGLVAGLVASWAIGAVIDLVIATWDLEPSRIIPALKVLLGVSLSYLGISTVLQTQDDFRLVIPYVEFAKQLRGPRPVLLDTSALIDGRIAEVAATGLIQQPIVIPQFVLEELQALADSQDKTKRTRGRRGLDIVAQLQRLGTADVSIDTTPVTRRAVDQMLVQLATELPASIMTTDSGLARVATIQQVTVVNIHELGDALKPAVLPGQIVEVELLRKGEHEGQAVGFLEDGTMIVAEDGEPRIGERVEMTLTSSMQTAAGRLLFARIDPDAEPASKQADESAYNKETIPKTKRSPIGPVQDGIDRPSPRNPRR
ncbi:MAG: PIN/TRAM domain-containing protein [Phycisphaerales bacterium]